MGAAAKRGAERLVTACPRCAFVSRLLSREGSWRRTSARIVSLCDMEPPYGTAKRKRADPHDPEVLP